MAANYKTRCPHCGAQFRISEDHLKQANGAVRCGSCLKVFQASENLVDEAPARPAAKPAAQPARKPAARPAASGQKPAAKKPAASPGKWSLPEEKKQESRPKWTLDDSPAEKQRDPLDEDFDDKPVTKSEYKSNDTSVSLGSTELSDSFMNLDEDNNESLRSEDFSDMAGAAQSEEGSGDESWAEKLLEELDEEPSTPAPSRKAEANSGKQRSGNAEPEEDWASEAGDFFGDEEPAPASAAGSDPAGDDWADEAGDFFSGLDFDDSAQNADDASLGGIDLPEVEKRPTRRVSLPKPDVSELNIGEMLRWGALSIGALAILGVQFLIFNFDQLARTPEWRGFYTTICNAAGCNLPNPSNVSELHGSNLVVRSHPSVPGALVVDVIVFNEARYQQPFPMLELGFYSLEGQAIASRAFSPDEYRQGELADMELMPVDTPVHISFEIMDPGEDAVNYTLRFRPAPLKDHG